ncbi:FitA-like ribbon-helix-helix domain-containing protein [Ramlibacter henchirensis]|uniref:FitA-like ribbon-helix-helix domain-containing protein n=1 Tax=Ramlibacter henchirensis TaxID=204072 RepID=UPI0014305EB5|nr:Arc family DNA-binding protein [Ramlibacter henchirensis]
MPTLSIKDVPEPWAEALRQRALRNHRSLQGELMSIVEQAIGGGPLPPAAGMVAEGVATEEIDRARPRIVGYDKRGWPIVRQGWKTPEQVVAELRRKYPEPVHDQPLGADILRQERDSR